LGVNSCSCPRETVLYNFFFFVGCMGIEESGFCFSRVVNFGLETVIIPKGVCGPNLTPLST